MFEFNGKAELSKLEVKRGTGEDSEVGVSITFKAEDFPASAAASALAASDASSVDVLFRSLSEDAERNSRFPWLKAIHCEAKWEAKHAITIEGFRRLRCDKVGSVRIKPRANGKFDAQFQIRLLQPPENFIELLAEHLNTGIKIKLEQEGELALTGGGTKAPTQAPLPIPAAKRARKAAPKKKAA